MLHASSVPPPEQLLTPKEFAHAFGVTSRTVHNWIEAGRVTSLRIGRAIRIPRAELARAARAPRA
jgi:excisionase family DNA binding protein